ncbi:dTDP-4-dehydrorhamnose reductase [Ruegeria sp. ANG-R]|uniref:dTDP-4-dehydrorhamnose reductase n=1 Tax=Ruegeria sp. ANG-R TaxID=1577903 RepID=UPI00057D95A5|nr:dTDP-4-dehydrorhamnose reductase [Ruegeria sp. ANG-R]KIC40593.1 dTDP-4-dehydrorhamnose reductase [Ruegeria sp. ANG-R]
MTVLVFGKTGQVAQALAAQARDAVFLGRDTADLSDATSCSAAIKKYSPQAVINAAAYTAVDRAEQEERLATAINGEAPGAMAATCVELGIPFVHISSDYVFNGIGDTPFSPEASTAPLGAYGRSKLAGETAVKAAGGTYAILRTSWVFSASGSNFLKTMLRLSETRDSLTVVADQVGGPTPASAIAKTCLVLAHRLTPDKSGIYHYSGAPDTSWAGFARFIFSSAGRDIDILDVSTADYPTAAERPLNSRLDCSDLEKQFGISRPDWKTAAAQIVDVLT